jgi:hypothetical protein
VQLIVHKVSDKPSASSWHQITWLTTIMSWREWTLLGLLYVVILAMSG